MNRSLPLLVAGVLTTTLLVAGGADAATILGETVTPNVPNGCTGFPDFDAFQETLNGVSSAAPAAGVITSWSFQAGPTTPSNVRLRVFRKTTTANTWLVVTDPGPAQSVPAASGQHTYPVRVPIAAGDFVGLHSTGGACYAGVPSGAVVRSVYESTALPVGGTAAFNTQSAILDLSATLEPDSDGDGFGDETQDGCPGSALTQAACPAPDTRITKRPKHAVIRAKIRFTSTVPGSTFRCSLDKRKFKNCSSPLVYACPAPGVHHLKVLATSPYGPVEAKPAKVTFHVLGRPGHTKGC